MRSIAYVSKLRFVALAAALLVFIHSAAAQTTQPAAGQSPRELNMLVLGDSILWGQGLKEQNKSWYLVKTWLETSNGTKVRERVEAHAGATIGSAGAEMPKSLTVHGEINSAWPTLHDQVDNAVRAYIDPAQVDLVLVDGCINDVNARRFLNAANTPEGIQALAQEKCGAPVEELLLRIASTFPNAHLVLTGYYPIMSDKTSRDFFMRALVKRFYSPSAPNPPKISSKEMLARLAIISATWYESSNRWLAEAVAKANAHLGSRRSAQRVLFAKIPFAPDHAFAAHRSQLWGFNASFLRKLLFIVSLGKVDLKTNDEVRNLRYSVCRDFFRRAPGETEAQKQTRKEQLLVCGLAAIGHPNRKGAILYADAIREQIRSLIGNPGWLRSPASAVTATSP